VLRLLDEVDIKDGEQVRVMILREDIADVVERYIGIVKLSKRITKEDVDKLEDELWLCM